MGDFPLEKILTISAADYCGMVYGVLSQYTPVGVHAMREFEIEIGKDTEVTGDSLREKIPEGTEVVVGYRVAIAARTSSPDFRAFNIEHYYIKEFGTALIPKKTS